MGLLFVWSTLAIFVGCTAALLAALRSRARRDHWWMRTLVAAAALIVWIGASYAMLMVGYGFAAGYRAEDSPETGTLAEWVAVCGLLLGYLGAGLGIGYAVRRLRGSSSAA